MKLSMPVPKIRPRVIVVGLLGHQQEEIEAQLGGRAQFHFVDKNRTNRNAIPANHDYIVLACNFINHALASLAKKTARGTRTKVVAHRGGVDTMVRKLDELLPK